MASPPAPAVVVPYGFSVESPTATAPAPGPYISPTSEPPPPASPPNLPVYGPPPPLENPPTGQPPDAQAPGQPTYLGPTPSPPSPRETVPTPPSATPNNSPTKTVAMAVVPSLAVCMVVAVLLWLWLKRRKNSQTVQNGSDESDGQHGNPDLERAVTGAGPRRYQYRELAAGTSDFADEEKLGRGGFGNVYRGRLPCGADNGYQEVAIKKFSMDSISQGRREFEAEVRIITQLRHRNLVQLHGWCDSRKGLLLVYELVPGGSLDRHIYNTDTLFTWPERYKIILGLGSALRYLHQEWEQCVLHGDIKPSNIMVDSPCNAKLGDFGLARLVDHGKAWQATKSVLGTAGYIDPEFVNTRRPSTESDVYSFGIVLLEIVCSKPPVILRHGGEPTFVLLKWVWSLYSQNAILDAADERLLSGAADQRQMERTLVVGLWCAHPDLSERPSISRAMNVLQSDDARLPDLSPQMYNKASPPPRNDVAAAGGYGGVSGSTFSGSGVPTSATTATTCSAGSFVS